MDKWDTWDIYVKFKLDDKIVRKSIHRLRQYRDKSTLFIGQNK